jgi:hypothetical protein
MIPADRGASESIASDPGPSVFLLRPADGFSTRKSNHPLSTGAASTVYDRHVTEVQQLRALADLHRLFERDGVEYWLFGGGRSTSTPAR